MIDTNIYFGRPGLLNRLFDPTGGMLATRERDTSVFSNKNGGSRVIRSLDGARAFALNYGALGRENFEIINNFVQGHMGPGPFVLLDPGRRNLLTVNQSSVTAQVNDLRGFTVAGAGGALSSDNTGIMASLLPRTLKWLFSTTTPASAVLTLSAPSTVWPGIPLYPRPYTFWTTVQATGGTIDVALRIDWLNGLGASVGTSTSTAVTVGTSAPVRLWVTGSPAPGGIFARCSVLPTVAGIASGEALYFAGFMLNEGLAPDLTWKGGTGVYPVSIISMPEKYGFAEPGMLVSPVLQLQEVR